MSPKRLVLASAAFLAGTVLLYNGFSGSKALAEKESSDAKVARPKIDLAFCIDTTGSMGNEIEVVKTKTKEIVAKLGGSKPAPDIRVGLVAYRDRGDEYVTKVFQFSDNIDQVVKDISSLNANGGGDEPEAVNQALHASVNDLEWSKDKKAVKLLFLIGDAGPSQYPNDYTWENESRAAIARGIQINTIACGNMSNRSSAHEVFEKIAKLADGKSEFLTYRQEVVDAASGARSTLVSSGGKTYKLDKSYAGSWRDGADKLVARGAAAPVSAGYAAASPLAASIAPSYAGDMASRPFSMAAGASAVSGRMMKARAMAPAPAMASAGGRGYEGASGGASYSGAMSRAESNLDDIVFGATKEAAKKKAGIDYKN